MSTACSIHRAVPLGMQNTVGSRCHRTLSWSSLAVRSLVHRQKQKHCLLTNTAKATNTVVSGGSSQQTTCPESHQVCLPPDTWVDALSETQRYVLADEWGFDLLGSSFPPGIDPSVLTLGVPEQLFEHDLSKAVVGLLRPLALMAAGLFWLWFMHGIIPLWQKAICWAAIGTGYAGVFMLAHECARGAYLPDSPATESLLGSILMAPSLFCFEAWRMRTFQHAHQVNQLWSDTTAWHPLTLSELAQSSPLRRKLLRLFTTTPLKLLGSITEIGHSMQGWDLRTLEDGVRLDVMKGWMVTGVFAGVIMPTLVAAGGFSALFNAWFMPWLVFHAWLSMLTLVQHTAPHIPWRPAGVDGTHDHSRAVVSGTVTLRLPSWLEKVLNYPNYHIPQHLGDGVVPFYNAKAATGALREKVWPYMSEAPLSAKLLVNHVTRWQVYDEFRERYITFEEAVDIIDKVEGEEQQQQQGHGEQVAEGATLHAG